MEKVIYTKQQLNCHGVYKLVFSHSEKCYIGSTWNSRGFKRRWYQHKKDLRKNKHHNRYLQHLYNKYGEDCMIFEIIEILDKSDIQYILEREEHWINQYDSYHNGYNLSEFADDSRRILQYVEKSRIPVLQYDLDGTFIKEWCSMTDTKDLCATGVRNAIKNQSTACGFQWRLKTDNYPLNIGKYYKQDAVRILCYLKNGEFLKEFNSILETSKELNVDIRSIYHCLSGEIRFYNKYIFRYFKEDYPLKIDPVCRQHSKQSPLKMTNITTGEEFIFYSFSECMKHGFNYGTLQRYFKTQIPFKVKKYNNQKFKCEKISYKEYLNYKYAEN